MDELVGEEIFDGEWTHAIAVMWWMVYLAGGKIMFPVEPEFWLENYPEDARLVLRKENGMLVLCAEEKVWAATN